MQWTEGRVDSPRSRVLLQEKCAVSSSLQRAVEAGMEGGCGSRGEVKKRDC